MWPFAKALSYNITTANWDATFQADLQAFIQSIRSDTTQRQGHSPTSLKITTVKEATTTDPVVNLLVTAYYGNR